MQFLNIDDLVPEAILLQYHITLLDAVSWSLNEWKLEDYNWICLKSLQKNQGLYNSVSIDDIPILMHVDTVSFDLSIFD